MLILSISSKSNAIFTFPSSNTSKTLFNDSGTFLLIWVMFNAVSVRLEIILSGLNEFVIIFSAYGFSTSVVLNSGYNSFPISSIILMVLITIIKSLGISISYLNSKFSLNISRSIPVTSLNSVP